MMNMDFLSDQAKEYTEKDNKAAEAKQQAEANKPKTAAEDLQTKETAVVDPPKQEIKDKPAEVPVSADKPKEDIVDKTTLEPKEWFDVEEQDKTNKQNSEKPTEIWKENEGKSVRDEATTKKLEEYDNLLRDPLVASIIEAKKAGKDALSILEEIKPIDYKKMSEESLVKLKFERLGLKDEELKDAIDDFMSNPKWRRLEEINNMRTSLEGEQNERLKAYRGSVKVNAEKQNEVFQKYEQELNGYSTSLVGKEMNGYTITKDIADNVKSNAQNTFFKSLFKEDGSWNAERIFNLSLLDTQLKNIVKTNVDKARNRGKGEVLDSITRPDANITTTRKPQENGVAQQEKELQSAQERFYNNSKGIKFDITNDTKKN